MKWTCLLLLLLLSLLFSRLSSPSSLSCKAISKHWQQSNLPFNPARGCPRGLHIPRKSCPPPHPFPSPPSFAFRAFHPWERPSWLQDWILPCPLPSTNTAPTSSVPTPAAHLGQGGADPELSRHPRGPAEPRELVPHPRVFLHALVLCKSKAPLTAGIQPLLAAHPNTWTLGVGL